MKNDIWKVIPGFEDYEVSESGLVRRVRWERWPGKAPRQRRLFKADGLTRATGDDALKLKGYWAVILYKNGKEHAHYVHRLVCLAFNGPPPSPEKRYVLHRDDNRDNNHFSNLYWGTQKENVDDALRNGKLNNHSGWSWEGKRKGSANPSAKLTADQVKVIKADTRNNRILAEEYGVSRSTISGIRNGYTWV